MSKNLLLIFLKYPEPGNVKTRIAKTIGRKKASYIYSAMARDLVNKLSNSDTYEISIFYDPEKDENDIKKWIKNYNFKYIAQVGNSLGERISNAFDKSFKLGAEKSIVIGTDCVDVTRNLLEKAFTQLNDSVDVVIGPAYDGGYYLLGLKKNCSDLFKNVEWSTEKVLDQTLSNIRKIGLQYKFLKTLKDIDETEDIDDSLLNIVSQYYPNFNL